MIKYLLTDLDGVIRMWNNQKLKDLEENMKISESNLLSICFEENLLNSVISGAISDSRWREIVKEKYSQIHHGFDTNPVIDSWNTSESIIDYKIFEIYKKYFSKAKIVLVTNATSKLNSDLYDAEILDKFDFIFNSSEMGLTKPNREYYERVKSDLNFENEEVLYIDDSIENIKTGISFGIRSHLYENISNLELFLKSIEQPVLNKR